MKFIPKCSACYYGLDSDTPGQAGRTGGGLGREDAVGFTLSNLPPPSENFDFPLATIARFIVRWLGVENG
jgi:hypothetical protein